MGFISKAKAKVAYERESYQMGVEHLRKVKEARPELYVKGFWRMTESQRRAAVRDQKK